MEKKKNFTEIHPESIREFRETGEAFLGHVSNYTTQKGTLRKKFVNEAKSLGACIDVRYTQSGSGYDNIYLKKCK